jgi:hypothetical protein
MSLSDLFAEFEAVAFDDVAFTDVDTFLDYLLEVNDGVMDESLVPTHFKFCRKNFMKAPDAQSIVENLCEAMEAGIEETVDITGLQTLLDYWYKNNKVFEWEAFGEAMPLGDDVRQEIISQFEMEETDEEALAEETLDEAV